MHVGGAVARFGPALWARLWGPPRCRLAGDHPGNCHTRCVPSHSIVTGHSLPAPWSLPSHSLATPWYTPRSLAGHSPVAAWYTPLSLPGHSLVHSPVNRWSLLLGFCYAPARSGPRTCRSRSRTFVILMPTCRSGARTCRSRDRPS